MEQAMTRFTMNNTQGYTQDQFDAMTDRAWITAANENDREALIQGIKTIYNCDEADIDAEGDIWIADLQHGPWLDDDGMAHVVRALKAGDM
jgi:hypothetical protein